MADRERTEETPASRGLAGRPAPSARGLGERALAPPLVDRSTAARAVDGGRVAGGDRGTVDVATAIERVRKILDVMERPALGRIESKTMTVMLVLPLIDPLSPAAARRMLDELGASGHLHLLLGLHVSEELRRWLVAKDVPWTYVRDHYRLGPFEVAQFVGGFAAGILKSFYEIAAGIVELVQLTADEERRWLEVVALLASGESRRALALASERAELYAGIVWRIAGYVAGLKLGEVPVQVWAAIGDAAARLRQRFMNHLWNLEFFQAGMLAGEVAALVIPLGVGLVKIGVGTTRLVVAALRRIPFRSILNQLAEVAVRGFLEDVQAVIRRGRQLASLPCPGGFQLQYAAAWGDLGAYVSADVGRGSVAMSELLDMARRWPGLQGLVDDIAANLAEGRRAVDEVLDDVVRGSESREARAGVRSPARGSPFVPGDQFIPAEAGKQIEKLLVQEWAPLLERDGFEVLANADFGRSDAFTRGWARKLLGHKGTGPDLLAIHRERKVLLVGDICPSSRSWIELDTSRFTELKGYGEIVSISEIEGNVAKVSHATKTRLYAQVLAEANVPQLEGYRIVAQDAYWADAARRSKQFASVVVP